MKITLINGSIRVNNQSMKVSEKIMHLLLNQDVSATLVDLNNFKEMFTGDYLDLQNTKGQQNIDLQNMLSAQVLYFVVPTYHHSMPGVLKNFFDLIDSKEVYNNKVIGLISSSGGREALKHTSDCLNGILSHNKCKSFILPKDLLIEDLDSLNEKRIINYINYTKMFL